MLMLDPWHMHSACPVGGGMSVAADSCQWVAADGAVWSHGGHLRRTHADKAVYRTMRRDLPMLKTGIRTVLISDSAVRQATDAKAVS